MPSGYRMFADANANANTHTDRDAHANPNTNSDTYTNANGDAYFDLRLGGGVSNRRRTHWIAV